MFQYEVEKFFVLIHIEETENVRMLDEFHDGNLTLDLLQHRLGQFATIDDLDGDFLASYTVDAQLDQASLALAQGLVEPVWAHIGQLLAARERAAILMMG